MIINYVCKRKNTPTLDFCLNVMFCELSKLFQDVLDIATVRYHLRKMSVHNMLVTIPFVYFFFFYITKGCWYPSRERRFVQNCTWQDRNSEVLSHVWQLWTTNDLFFHVVELVGRWPLDCGCNEAQKSVRSIGI